MLFTMTICTILIAPVSTFYTWLTFADYRFTNLSAFVDASEGNPGSCVERCRNSRLVLNAAVYDTSTVSLAIFNFSVSIHS